MRRLEPIAHTASPEEAAAIVAGIERFLHETVSASISTAESPDPWTRAAMLEGVGRENRADVFHPWINT
jgi:hypothetical protein